MHTCFTTYVMIIEKELVFCPCFGNAFLVWSPFGCRACACAPKAWHRDPARNSGANSLNAAYLLHNRCTQQNNVRKLRRRLVMFCKVPIVPHPRVGQHPLALLLVRHRLDPKPMKRLVQHHTLSDTRISSHLK